ncbi:hypothetical protein [Borreliella kurtenbachii]
MLATLLLKEHTALLIDTDTQAQPLFIFMKN